jgi:hypothetical protein
MTDYQDSQSSRLPEQRFAGGGDPAPCVIRVAATPGGPRRSPRGEAIQFVYVPGHARGLDRHGVFLLAELGGALPVATFAGRIPSRPSGSLLG